jgi:hypothetical protein
MTPLARRRRARRADLGLDAREYARLRALATPSAIQAFVDAIPANREPDGDTVHSVRSVLRHGRAHCIEGAMLAACALWVHGEPPLLMHFDCADHDNPHVVALFRRDRQWGAISKANHVALRFRDPVHRTLRELALTYFHEYCDYDGRKTMRSYSNAFDLRRFDPRLWVTSDDACWLVHDKLSDSRHHAIVTARQVRALRPLDAFELRVANIEQHKRRR